MTNSLAQGRGRAAAAGKALDLIQADANVSEAFRDALQLALPHWSFRALTRRDDEHTAVGYGYPADLSDYRADNRYRNRCEDGEF